MHQLKSFLNEDGYIFFAFPPWQMPYGGHQQVCKNSFLSKLPYYHLLPGGLYKAILKAGGENELTINELMEAKSTGISIEEFEKALAFNNLETLGKEHFLFNPIYSYKFGVKPKKQYSVIRNIPFLRNFFTTACYYLVGRK